MAAEDLGRTIRWSLALAGVLALAGSLASVGPWSSPVGLLILLAIASMPLIGYATSLRTIPWSLVTGIALLALTLWTSIGFALVPRGTRDGIEMMWLFYQCLFGIPLAALGLLIERRWLGRANRSG